MKNKTPLQKCKLCRQASKLIVCAVVIGLTIPGVTSLSLASVVVWFYGESFLSKAMISLIVRK